MVIFINMLSGYLLGESDYDIPEMITVMFPAGQNNVAFNISIVDNEITECPENFTLQLVIPKSAADLGVVTKSDDTAVVNIMDDDGKKCIQCIVWLVCACACVCIRFPYVITEKFPSY